MTIGRGAVGAEAGRAAVAGLRFVLRRAAGLRRAPFFFFAIVLVPARLFAFAIRTSVVLEASAQCGAAWVLIARSRYSNSGSSLMPPLQVTAFDTGSIATREKMSSSESARYEFVVTRSPS